MKKFFLKATAAISFCVMFAMASCSKDAAKPADNTQPAATTETAAQTLPNYRYVDLDSVLSKYNLAKDYNEEMLRMQANMESEVKRHENSIQSFAASVQKKIQNNGYLTEASYKADEDKLNNMQANAQRAVATLQGNFEKAAMAGQKTVNDSIQAFIKEYNAKKGYDAILIKSFTLYINPALDITNEVAEGLNARYNKVKD